MFYEPGWYMKHIKLFIFSIFVLTSAVFSEKPELDSNRPKENAEIIVAVAANFKNPIEEIRTSFLRQNPKYKITIIFGASGQLASQIRSGAPVDLFLSADMDFPETLYKEGFSKNQPKVYAKSGRIVRWSKTESGTYQVAYPET